jgi:hypothetical protein
MTPSPTVISPHAAIARVAQALWLPAPDPAHGISISLIGQALRRAAHILAPCPRHELERAVRQSLKDLSPDIETLTARIAETLDMLLAYGDILEMRASADDPWTTSRLLVRPGSPAFVLRKNSSVIILGVAGDEITPLSSEMNQRLAWHGVLRTLIPEGTENLRVFLSEQGLIELSEKSWLRLPPAESAAHYSTTWASRLAEAPLLSAIEGLQILDTRRPPTFYSGRWVEPNSGLNGMHIARRAQRYGAPLWCVVDLDNGVPRRFLDLAARIDRERPCDLAWRLQMAMDAEVNTPQRVRLRTLDQAVVLDFFSPLPSWAERRLAVVGERTQPHRSLLAYVVPRSEVDELLKFITNYLWIMPEA